MTNKIKNYNLVAIAGDFGPGGFSEQGTVISIDLFDLRNWKRFIRADRKFNTLCVKFTKFMFTGNMDSEQGKKLKAEYLELDKELSEYKEWVRHTLGYDPSKYFFRTKWAIQVSE
jgi:hypothetical protein